MISTTYLFAVIYQLPQNFGVRDAIGDEFRIPNPRTECPRRSYANHVASMIERFQTLGLQGFRECVMGFVVERKAIRVSVVGLSLFNLSRRN